ncbi:hypothetical protein [Mycolicibacterium sp.]|uniref:hypothetical protein n=1 Tax=Mycolicibacterium sp. TaxID=2320850 RepID=UPI00093F9A02|nr:hypothetical protein EB73_02775 [Mycobacterium sp. SWH-M3]
MFSLSFSPGTAAPRLTVAAAAGLALLALGAPAVSAAPSTDAQGYVDSTARCATAADTVLYASTEGSRLAICSVPGGKYEYRGVRLRDGARLIVPATRSDDGAFIVENAGVTYLITSKSLAISVGERVIREEPMVDFNRPGAAAPAQTPTSSTPLPPPLAAEVGGSSR